MRKPSFNLFNKFKEKFDAASKKAGKADMPVIPYFISSYPGSRPEDMVEMALKTKELGFWLEQVQDFTPTPMTVATKMDATGVHPCEGGQVAVARTAEEKWELRSIFFWYKPEMRQVLRGTLQRLGLKDIARRLLDKKKATRDVTPPPHIGPCGMKLPAGPGGGAGRAKVVGRKSLGEKSAGERTRGSGGLEGEDVEVAGGHEGEEGEAGPAEGLQEEAGAGGGGDVVAAHDAEVDPSENG